MNIFKVLASSKKGFFEEQASVILAWLLNPYMDHGLGFTFLREFLAIAAPEILEEHDKPLQSILRSDRSSEELKFSLDIEYNVDGSFIDIIFFVNDFIVSIENKIKVESASDENQLVLQYEGLKRKFSDKKNKIFMIFLVPDEMHRNIEKEYNALKLKKEYTDSVNCFRIIEWKEIYGIIKNIIEQDSRCEIDPIDDYLRYTLKAFSTFIDGDFSGYDFEDTKTYGNMNPLAEGKKTLEQIRNDNNIKYVGVRDGIIGLLRLSKEDLSKKTFQFTSENMNSPKWLKKDLFINVSDCIVCKKFVNINWIDTINSSFPYNIIYNIAVNTEENFFIGIKGGETSLENMNNKKIENGKWGLSLKKESSQWIEKEKYIDILRKKEIF